MPRQGLNRNAVVDAAIEIVERDSFQALSLGAIARKLDIRPPSLYKHIKNLEDLQDELGIRGATDLTEKLKSRFSNKNPEKALYDACEIYRGFAREHSGLYDAIQPAMLRRSPEFQKAAIALLESIFPLVSALGIEKKNLIHATRSLRSLLHGFIDLERKGGFGMPTDIDISFKFLVRNYIQGLKS